MFENNADVDFGDDFTVDFHQVATKRSLGPPQSVSPKRIKIIPKNAIKRKFPGPAGLLPDSEASKSHDEIPCSQMSLSVFEDSPWIEMSRDYENLIDKFDIKWIKTIADLSKLQDQKAPFLGAVIKSIECFVGQNAIVRVVLKDVTGEIQGTIIHSLYEEYSKSLVTGSVIVLQGCGVLTTSYSNNHYLTIARSNLVTIYWRNNDEVEVIKVQEVSCEDLLNKENLGINSSKVEIKTSQGEELVEVWRNALEGIDIDSLFDDF